jgi:1-acyl-sn-glycerol-3-phosphate acyltransferase
MTPNEIWITLRQWVPFAMRTVAYGTISCVAGPLTRDHAASLWAMREWCIKGTRGLGIEVEVSGLENAPQGAFIYCSNHQSMVDILVLGSVLPGDYKWAAKRSLMRVPFLGWHLRLAGHVPVDRGGGIAAADRVIERFVAVLKSGFPLLIFPEGTRTLDGELKPFKPGAFRAAVRAGAPIVPVGLDGTFEMMSKGDVHAGNRRKLVRVRIGAPIPPPEEGEEAERVGALRELASLEVARLFESIRQSAPH